MEPDRQAFLLALLRRASVLDGAERDQFIARASAGDPELRAALERMAFELEADALSEPEIAAPDADPLASAETVAHAYRAPGSHVSGVSHVTATAEAGVPTVAHTLSNPEPPFDDEAVTVAPLPTGPASVKGCPVCGTLFPGTAKICPDDGEPLVTRPDLLVGTTLDGLYRVECLLGSGGVGTVYRARHTLLGDLVAIKVLSDAAAADASWLRRFLREGQAARRFRHPNAVIVHDLRVSQEGPVYLVLEYVDGPSLRHELHRRGRFEPREALAILQQVAGALDAAHRAGVIHRDLKPENIMLTMVDGGLMAKVVDLGVARVVGERSEDTGNLTGGGIALGTPRYMSPEQWGVPQRDGVEVIDGRTDVYSLAVTAFEMLGGHTPFNARNLHGFRHMHANEQAPLLTDVLEDCCPHVARAIDAGLAKDRADRPETPGAFVALLAQAIDPAGTALAGTRPALPAGHPGAADVTIDTLGTRHPTVLIGSETREMAPSSLPPELTRFVGSRAHVAALCDAQAVTRVLTLVGVGGIGKTRLALQAARDRREAYADGVWFVDLAAIADPELVATAIAAVVGIHEQPGRPVLDALRSELAGRSSLIVLDNCEHVRDGCAAVIASLVPACPRVSVLATSREPLGVAGEQLWNVTPLGVPEAGDATAPDVLARVESVALFVDRARVQRRSFTLSEDNAAEVAELCVRLEGIPLAIELAAARCGVLTPAQILERLAGRLDLLATRQADVPSRQRTLRASIDWSVQLLEPEVRRLLAALSVFRGGWTLEAAEAVCASAVAVEPGLEVVDALDRLRESSLISADDDGGAIRFRMLELIREFADGLLADGARLEIRRAHAAWAAELAQAARLWERNEDQTWMRRLDAEVANIRAAAAFGRTSEADPGAAVRLVAAILPYWSMRDTIHEGRASGDAVLAAHPGADPVARATALNGLSMLAVMQSEPAAARAYARAALDGFTAIGDDRGAADALERLARVAIVDADYHAARAHTEASAAIWRRLGDTARLSMLDVTFGWISQELGEFERSREELERAAEALRRSGNKRGIAVTSVALAETLYHLDDPDGAMACLAGCIETAREIGHRFLVGSALHTTSVVACDAAARGVGLPESLERAESAADEAVAINRELGSPDSLGAAMVVRGNAALVRGDLALAAEQIATGTRMRYGSAGRRGVAIGLEAAADLARAAGASERAARLLGAADTERAAVGAARSVVESRQTAERESRLVAALGPDAFGRHRAEGRALSLVDAVNEATSPLL